MKNSWFSLTLVVMALSIITACGDSQVPASERCLPDNSLYCEGTPNNTGGNSGNAGQGNAGTGGNVGTCQQDSRVGQACGVGGIYVCLGNNPAPSCVSQDGGVGGNSGTGGSGGGGYNCYADPIVGTSCGTNGTYACLSSSTLICKTGGQDGGTYTCQNDSALGKPCGTNGIFVCEPNGKYLICQQGGSGGSGGGGYNCYADPIVGKPCGSNSTYVCLSATSLACVSNGTGGTGGGAGTGGQGGSSGSAGSGGNAGQGGSGGSGYSCQNDPMLGKPCGNGGTFTCVTNNGVQSLTCTGGGTGGSGGSSGSGGQGGSSGSAGSGGSGGTDCTTVSSSSVTLIGDSSLKTLRWGESTLDNSNPQTKLMSNNNLLSLKATAGISVTISAGKMNLWSAYPLELIDTEYCRLKGINPPTPESCNAAVIGNRDTSEYITGLSKIFQCWRSGNCDPLLTVSKGSPASLFSRTAMLPGTTYKASFTQALMVVEMPPLCQ